MFWRILESAIASAVSRTMIDARLEALFDRVGRMGVLTEAEIGRLRAEIIGRLEDVEREGREIRAAIDRAVQGVAGRFLQPRGRPGDRNDGSGGGQ